MKGLLVSQMVLLDVIVEKVDERCQIPLPPDFAKHKVRCLMRANNCVIDMPTEQSDDAFAVDVSFRQIQFGRSDFLLFLHITNLEDGIIPTI